MLTIKRILISATRSAKILLMNINKRKARCIIISKELKVLPIIWLSLVLWIKVVEAIIIGEMSKPKIKVKIAAIKKLGYRLRLRLKTANIMPLKIKEEKIAL